MVGSEGGKRQRKKRGGAKGQRINFKSHSSSHCPFQVSEFQARFLYPGVVWQYLQLSGILKLNGSVLQLSRAVVARDVAKCLTLPWKPLTTNFKMSKELLLGSILFSLTTQFTGQQNTLACLLPTSPAGSFQEVKIGQVIKFWFLLLFMLMF